MFNLRNKNVSHNFPSRHDIVLKMEHLIHDERFWGLVLIFGLLAGLIILTVLLSIYGKPVSGQGPKPIPPYYW